MFRIGKLFHLTQVVDDLERVDRWHDDVFAAERFYSGYEELAGRDASLVAIGDVVLEPMTPARVEPLRNPSVKRFHDRFGQHAHSIAWYVDDVQAISATLDDAGFRLFNLVGRQVKPPHKASAVWTHPQGNAGAAGVRGLWRLPARSAHEEGLVERPLAPPPARDRRRFLDRHRRERHNKGEAPLL